MFGGTPCIVWYVGILYCCYCILQYDVVLLSKVSLALSCIETEKRVLNPRFIFTQTILSLTEVLDYLKPEPYTNIILRPATIAQLGTFSHLIFRLFSIFCLRK
uniref:Uncharacterized protein n=1 Tax=Cacopsylla melanoneura TaxID=428564 RepID=A0A8D8VT68_9HEMI